MECVSCGCSEYDACVDDWTGDACGWAATDARPVCTFCAEDSADEVAQGALREAEQAASWMAAEHEQQESPEGQRVMADRRARDDGRLFATNARVNR